MTDSVFDVALEKRFTESGEIALIDVTSADLMLIRNNESGVIMRIPILTLASAMNAALTGSTIISKLGYTPENAANKGAANGYAELDSGGKVPSAQLPSFVDDVSEYANLASFPATGETGKIYVSLATNLSYRWSGSSYVEISQSLALGETSSTAYRGDRGKTAYDHSQLISGNPHNVTKSDVGLSNVDNTADSNKIVAESKKLKTTAMATSDDPPSAYTHDGMTCRVTQGVIGLPESGYGILTTYGAKETDSTNWHLYIRQIYMPSSSTSIYSRNAASSSVWNSWHLISQS